MAANQLNVAATASALNDDITAVQVRVAAQLGAGGGAAAAPAVNKRVLIVLDRSGSMAGSAMEQSRRGIHALVEALTPLGVTDISLVTYATGGMLNFAGGTPLEWQNTLNGVSASGGTSFVAAFDLISNALLGTREFVGGTRQIPPALAAQVARGVRDEVAIVFFTDGVDSDKDAKNTEKIYAKLRGLGAAIAPVAASCEFHTIGFSADHDARLLQAITEAGTVQGTFQYVKSAADIGGAMNTISQVLTSRNLAGHVVCGGVQQKLSLTMDETGVNYTGTAFIRSVDLPSFAVVLSVGEETQEFRPACEARELGAAERVDLLNAYITSQVRALTARVITPGASREELTACRNECAVFEAQLLRLTDSLHKLKSTERKILFPLCEGTITLFGAFHEVLAAALANTLTNDKIASLNALAYRGNVKKGLQKQLDKRVEANVELFEKMEGQIQEAVQKLDKTALRARYAKEATDVGQCALSCQDFIDAMLDGDCMCITLDVGRSAAAIADPSQVVIKTINSTVMTAESFLNAVQFRLSAGGNAAAGDMGAAKDGYDVAATSAHGGFNRAEQGCITIGEGREPITGCLPLFLNEEHWSIARHKMRPIMGWTATLDVLGYSYQQVKVIPFLVLAKAAQDCTTEHQRRRLALIMETCKQIYKDASRPDFEVNMRNDTKRDWENYMKGPVFRTVDVIPSQHVFLAQLIVAMELGDIPRPDAATADAFFSALAEEELRRSQPYEYRNAEQHEIHSWIFDILDIDYKLYIEDHIAAFKEDQAASSAAASASQPKTDYAKKFRDALATRGLDVGGGSMFGDEDAASAAAAAGIPARKLTFARDHPGKVPVVTPAGRRMLENIIGSGGFVNNVAGQQALRPLLLTGRPGDVPFDSQVCSLASVGFTTNEQVFALLLQNLLTARNADRRQLCIDGKYIDPRTAPEAFLKRIIETVVEEQRLGGINALMAAAKSDAAGEVGAAFGRATTEDEAAGVLLGMFRGTAEFHACIRVLQTEPNCPLALAKWNMLVSDRHRIALFADQVPRKVESPEVSVQWFPKRKNFYWFFNNNRNILTKRQWKTEFPLFAEYLGRVWAHEGEGDE